MRDSLIVFLAILVLTVFCVTSATAGVVVGVLVPLPEVAVAPPAIVVAVPAVPTRVLSVPVAAVVKEATPVRTAVKAVAVGVNRCTDGRCSVYVRTPYIRVRVLRR